MRIDYIPGAKLMPGDLAPLLGNPDDEVFVLVGKIRIPHPNFVFSGARYFDLLRDGAARFVRGRGH